ncbi:hypothetical protein [Streptomyces sp. NRRL S-350]|uniref:hypothetical protein n=1 Tax=Streptomyces sp. NRRL S-350 TaxID=1463902 RepID=UPI0004BF2DFE|nr:hypothetical protein [Streptomyces sp. NRRL S-350]
MIRVTDGEGRTTELIAVIPPRTGGPAYAYTDANGDKLAVFTAVIPALGPGIHIVTRKAGCLIPAEAAGWFVRELRTVGQSATGADEHGPVEIGEPEPGPYSKLTGYHYVDADKDVVRMKWSALPDGTPAVHVVTSPAGCSIPLAALPLVTGWLLTTARAAEQHQGGAR